MSNYFKQSATSLDLLGNSSISTRLDSGRAFLDAAPLLENQGSHKSLSIPVRHSGGPLGLTLTLTLTPGMADLRNGEAPLNGGTVTLRILSNVRCESSLGHAHHVSRDYDTGRLLASALY